jgi:hypothetical protein
MVRCWQASSVLVSRQRICWCRRSCRESARWVRTPHHPKLHLGPIAASRPSS